MSEATRIGTASSPPEKTRQRLLDAATEVFLEKGYEGTRVAEIARRAGLTTGAIYGNFNSKADLLTAALAAGCETQHRLFLDLLAMAPRDNAAAAAVDAALKAAEEQIEDVIRERDVPSDVGPDAMRLALELMALGAIVMQALGREMPTAPDIAHVMKVAAAVISADS
ncbi:MAG: TetR/AcrR family transcriptional regulator [Actinobacteria bacterium]|nr:TetR/AcrR family transcriptional regulator [Actinomycetota bacterium]